MASRTHSVLFKNQLFALALLSVLVRALASPAQVYALESTNSFPSLPEFIQSVRDGTPGVLRGVYIQGVMAYAVVQQPMGNPGYVAITEDTVTQFSIASEVGNIGLLAHNYLAGANFSNVTTGNIITLVYGDGITQSFIVESVHQYQALSPLSPYSDFKNLQTGDVLNVEQLFTQVYRGDFHLTLQTCIEKDGDLSWGRLFIVAVPLHMDHLDSPADTGTQDI